MTPAPKPGERVTPENVADLPIGTVVEYSIFQGKYTATKTDDNEWSDNEAPVYFWDDGAMVDAKIVAMDRPYVSPNVGASSSGDSIATVIALLTHAARTDGAHHKQHDVCAALKVLLSAENYAALGIVDEGVPS